MGSEDHDRERIRDIIKRLLNRAVNAEIIKEKPNLYYDAAHQIEQLYDENEKLRANNDYLRSEKERLGKDVYNLIVKKDEARAENEKFFKQAEMNDIIERLNTEIKEIRAAWAFETTALRAENEKLRKALKPFADAVKDKFNWKYDINSDDFHAAAAAIKESGE